MPVIARILIALDKDRVATRDEKSSRRIACKVVVEG